MANNDKALSVLKRIGLNLYEGKVYSALLSAGLSSAGEISETADVPRSRVYDVLTSLEKKGFAIVQMDRPVKYLPVQPKDVLQRIRAQYKKELEEKLEKLGELEAEVVGALEPLTEKGGRALEKGEASGMIRGRQNIHRQMEQMITSAKKSICKLTTPEGLARISKHHKPHLSEAKRNGVKTRLLAHVSQAACEHARSLQDVSQVKHLKNIKGQILLKDGNEALITISPEGAEQDSAIWVKSDYLGGALQHMFDHMWDHGEEISP